MAEQNPILYKGSRITVVQKGDKEIIHHPDAAVILPLVAPNKVIMIQNKRVAVDETLLELPAGTIEEDELPLIAAKRELLEETGFRTKSIRPLVEFYSAPGFCNQRIHAFVAEDLQLAKASPNPGEDITVVIKTFSEILSLIKEGKIIDAKSLTTLMHYVLF